MQAPRSSAPGSGATPGSPSVAGRLLQLDTRHRDTPTEAVPESFLGFIARLDARPVIAPSHRRAAETREIVGRHSGRYSAAKHASQPAWMRGRNAWGGKLVSVLHIGTPVPLLLCSSEAPLRRIISSRLASDCRLGLFATRRCGYQPDAPYPSGTILQSDQAHARPSSREPPSAQEPDKLRHVEAPP